MDVSDKLLHSHSTLSKTIMFIIVVTMLISVYIMQRALTDILRVTPNALFWSGNIQYAVFGLTFRYATLTIVWPLFLGFLCFVFHSVVKKRSLIESFLLTEWISSESNFPHRQNDEMQHMPPILWHSISFVPSLVLIFHLIAVLSYFAQFRDFATVGNTNYYPFFGSGSPWTKALVFTAVATILISSIIGLWCTNIFRQAISTLRQSNPNMFIELIKRELVIDIAIQRLDSVNGSVKVNNNGSMLSQWEIFISAKKLDDNGNLTRDNMIADELYDFMQDKGFSVFLSNRSLEKLGVSDYKKSIDDALDKSSCLVAVGTSAKNLHRSWVRYEWDSFLNDVLSGVKPKGKIFVYVEDVPINELPRPLRQSQVFIHNNIGEMERLYNFINNSLSANDTKDLR